MNDKTYLLWLRFEDMYIPLVYYINMILEDKGVMMSALTVLRWFGHNFGWRSLMMKGNISHTDTF